MCYNKHTPNRQSRKILSSLGYKIRALFGIKKGSVATPFESIGFLVVWYVIFTVNFDSIIVLNRYSLGASTKNNFIFLNLIGFFKVSI